MQIEITGTPQFHFAIGKDDLAVLTLLSTHHYDWHCRTYSKTAAEVGKNGLLVIWGMCLESAEADGKAEAEVSATWRDLDTLLKCMEMPQCLQSEAEQARVPKLRQAFFQALTHARTLQDQWVAKFDTQTAPVAGMTL